MSRTDRLSAGEEMRWPWYSIEYRTIESAASTSLVVTRRV